MELTRSLLRAADCLHSWNQPLGPDFFKHLLDNLYDGVYFVDTNRRVLYWNKGAERISGYTAADVVGKPCFASLFDHPDGLGCHLCQNACPLARTFAEGEMVTDRVHLRHRDGRRVAVDLHAIPIRDSHGQMMGGVQIFRDASATVALELAYGHLRELVEKDSLTGVSNRRHLDAFLLEQLAVSRRTGLSFSVIMADLDRFKWINDTWGHDVGDQVLVAFAAALKARSRTTDVVGRYGGEEFLVILPGTRLADAVDVAERMREDISARIPSDSAPCRATASFGITEAQGEDTPQSILCRADAALYLAKNRGRNRVATGTPDEADESPVDVAFSPPSEVEALAHSTHWVL